MHSQPTLFPLILYTYTEKSLEDLMKDVADKLDELPPPKPASQSMEGSFKDAGNENWYLNKPV